MKGVGRDVRLKKGKHIITSRSPSTRRCSTPAKHLEKEGFEVTYLQPDGNGAVSAEQVAEAIREDTILVSVMWANNEIGTINPIREIGALCHEKGVLFFTDATQAVGKVPVDVEADNIDMLCLSGHKIYGPKGVGCLYVRRRNPRVRLVAQMDGGGHERGMRSGTLNVPGIVGLGAACAVAEARTREGHGALQRPPRALREARSSSELDYVEINGDKDNRLPHGCSNISFAYVEGESLIMGFKDLAVSSGSACTSASLEPSHVLQRLRASVTSWRTPRSASASGA